MAIIETEDLTKEYDGLIAVNKLNLKVEEGEIFGLLGPNGAGKSTTLLMLTTIVRPTSGTARVNGFDVVHQPDHVRRSIGIVFQDPSSDDTLTAYENLKLHGMLYNMPKDLREKRIKEVLELVDLTDRKDDLVKQYSGGMRRRLELGRGLMHHPKIVFLDEPTLGLDPQSRENIWHYVEKLSKEERISVIITTHYMDEADKLCNRLAIIDKGRIVASDSPEMLKKVIGGDVINIKIKYPDLEKIKKLDFVKKITEKNGIVSLAVTDANKHLAQILQVIGNVDSVELRSPTLDDVFLLWKVSPQRDESAEGGWAEKIVNYRSKK
ncbi:MAG: ATP-binding cassette domain-containing protein [Patescibacteria group bacterium]|nr:ATP-binding cassette domain-containing protein [Patescibacteria group bacterium]